MLIGFVRVEDPGIPLLPVIPPAEGLKPMASLLIAPSTVTLLYRKLLPIKLLSLLAWGTIFVISVILRDIDGVRKMASREKLLPPPNRPPREARPAAFTVTPASSVAFGCSLKSSTPAAPN